MYSVLSIFPYILFYSTTCADGQGDSENRGENGSEGQLQRERKCARQQRCGVK